MKTLLLTCDLEDFDVPADFGFSISEEKAREVTSEGLRRVLELAGRLQGRMTFFVTASVVERFGEQIRELARMGHEIGVHAALPVSEGAFRAEEIQSLERARLRLEREINARVYGFRSHKLRLPVDGLLGAAGYAYDSSLHPTYVPGRYCHLFKSRAIASSGGVIEVPISVTPLLRLPFSWFWMRNGGIAYLKICSLWAWSQQDFLNVYFHNWDLADLEKPVLRGRLPRFVRNNAGETMVKLLGKYLRWCGDRDIQCETIKEHLARKKLLSV
ncbi:MAG TPA: polysaccharide deacetylase family protein [Elusimicrobiota bacterium]|nr:polysaccharide deacetylase family protein [Elusimicrobiota bacterium]